MGNIVRLMSILALCVVLSVIVAAGAIIGGAGIFWLFVYGDDPWPGSAETALVAAGYGAGLLAGVAVFVVLARTGPLRLQRPAADQRGQRRPSST